MSIPQGDVDGSLAGEKAGEDPDVELLSSVDTLDKEAEANVLSQDDRQGLNDFLVQNKVSKSIRFHPVVQEYWY